MKLGVFANVKFIESFTELLSLDLPVKTAYKLSKIHKVLSEESETFTAKRKEIILKHALKNDDGSPNADESGNVQIPNNSIEGVNQELFELSDIDFEVGTIPLDSLGDINISAKTLSLLSDLFTEE